MTTATPASGAPVDLKALKAKQQLTWASGDFAVIGTTLQIVGELLCEAADVGGGERVLDGPGDVGAQLTAQRVGVLGDLGGQRRDRPRGHGRQVLAQRGGHGGVQRHAGEHRPVSLHCPLRTTSGEKFTLVR